MKVFKTIFALVLAAAFVAVGVWGYPRVAARFTWVAIAAINLSPGMPIREGMAILKLYRVDKVPEGAMHSLETIIGNYARERIAKGEIVRPSAVAAKTPPPVRTTDRRGYFIRDFAVPREDVYKLFVGDRVDVRVTFVERVGDPNSPTSTETIRKGWVIHHIDYDNQLRANNGQAVVFLDIPSEEFWDAFGKILYEDNKIRTRPRRADVRMTRSAPREE